MTYKQKGSFWGKGFATVHLPKKKSVPDFDYCTRETIP